MKAYCGEEQKQSCGDSQNNSTPEEGDRVFVVVFGWLFFFFKDTDSEITSGN